MDDIKLPPLPEKTRAWPRQGPEYYYDADQLQTYARKAVLMDREYRAAIAEKP